MARAGLSLYTDGSAIPNPGPAAIGYAIFDQLGRVIEKGARYIGRSTSNEAEYEALLWGIEKLRERTCGVARVFTDSELVAKQHTGEYRTKDARMAEYARRLRANVQLFDSFSLTHVSRENDRIKVVHDLVEEARKKWFKGER
ncbi:MAG TPA: ribonuclease HI family protein [Thermoplasmata archaeon]